MTTPQAIFWEGAPHKCCACRTRDTALVLTYGNNVEYLCGPCAGEIQNALTQFIDEHAPVTVMAPMTPSPDIMRLHDETMEKLRGGK